jgi:hypothetical protein
VIIFSILSEVYDQEIFEEKISLYFNILGSIYNLPYKFCTALSWNCRNSSQHF